MPGKKRTVQTESRVGRRTVEHESWPAVILYWIDANSHHGDFPLTEVLEEPLPVRRSIGFLVEESDERLVLVGTDDRGKFSAIEHIADSLEIPPSLIIKRIDLQPSVSKSSRGRRGRGKRIGK